MATILVVDDEPQIARIAADYLERAGYGVLVATDGVMALQVAQERHPDLIVLDLGLPRVDGMVVARRLREQSDVPIIMLTARVDESDRLAGLEIGADDYMPKPFSPRELGARTRAVLRRTRTDDDAARFRVADLNIDVPRMRLDRDGTTIDLTPTEFQLVLTLARRPGRIFTRTQLLDAVRGTDVDAFDRAIDTHVKNIRRTLEPDPRHPRYVMTVYGAGYRFADA